MWKFKNESVQLAIVIKLRYPQMQSSDEYEILIEYEKNTGKCRISKELLKWEKQAFFQFDGNDVHLYRINNKTNQAEKGTSFPAGWSRSVIPTIAERNDNLPLIRFREEIRKWLIVQPAPVLMAQVAESEDKRLSKYADSNSMSN